MRFVYLAIVLNLLALQGCATNPVTGEQDFVLMSEREEISLGQKYDQQITQEMPVYQNPELAAYVNEVGQRIARVSHRFGNARKPNCACSTSYTPAGNQSPVRP